MMIYFLFIFFNIICNCFYFFNISFINFIFHFCNQLCIHIRKIIHKV